MEEYIISVLTHPFTLGALCGFALSIYFLMNLIGRKREADNRAKATQGELEKLREHLNTHLELNAKGSEELKKELTNLRTQNENLRITVQTLKAKPGRTELRTLELYDKTVRRLNETAPGFSAAWESAMREAEKELSGIDTGLLPMVKKVFRPALANVGGGNGETRFEFGRRDDSDATNANANGSGTESASDDDDDGQGAAPASDAKRTRD